MDAFFNGSYNVRGIVPLNPFPPSALTGGDPFAKVFGDNIFDDNHMEQGEFLDYVQLRKWFRKGDSNALVKNVPYPRDLDNNPLPHGAKLDFDVTPVKLQPRQALIWWLTLRYVTVPNSYPMESFK